MRGKLLIKFKFWLTGRAGISKTLKNVHSEGLATMWVFTMKALVRTEGLPAPQSRFMSRITKSLENAIGRNDVHEAHFSHGTGGRNGDWRVST
jgi:hypothetical protein